MFARFFIDRPVFAWVISIVIVLAGVGAALRLPIAQYPEITPPTVTVTANYPGADAKVVADTVAAPIEQQVNGVEKMLYMSSQSSNDGSYALNVTFELGVDLNMAQVLVQNRVAMAMPTLPEPVQKVGVTTKKKSPSILLVVNLISEINKETGKPIYDQLYLSNYATIRLRDELARIDGVGDVGFLGQQDYSMRVWLDPDKLATRGMTAGDVVRSLQEQNVQVAAGAIGRPPIPAGQDLQLTMTTLGRLVDPSQFGDIIVRTGTDSPTTSMESTNSAIVRLRDVGRIVLGARSEDQSATLDGQPTVGIAIFQLPGSNALDVADRILNKMKELRGTDQDRKFPLGLEYKIVYDTTPFIKESVAEVFHTLRDAIILVTIVILLFLQDWRAMILPLIDVAVSLIGTFAVMYWLGFSLNNLTLFGLVLAIGIVVDDAIVVLENIEVWMAKGYQVREATIHAMDEITGPIVGITLVLCSVFLPSAILIGGITGQFFKQFALTIAASMLLSAINALTMTPARATTVFGHRKVGSHGHDDSREALPWWGIAAILGWLAVWFLAPYAQKYFGVADQMRMTAIWVCLFLPAAIIGWALAHPVNYSLGRFFRGFNWLFDKATAAYGWVVGRMLRLSAIVGLAYLALLALTYLGFIRVPTGFIPNQDKGYLVINILLPDSASVERTKAVAAKVDVIARETEGVAHTVINAGQSFVLNAFGSNYGGGFIPLKHFDERRGHHLHADAIAAKIRARVAAEIPEAIVSVFGAPPVDGLGNAGGFKLMVEDRGSVGLEVLQGQADNLAFEGNKQPGLVGLFNGFRSNTPQLFVDVDRTKCKALGVALSDVFQALQVFMGGYYVNDFNQFGRTWQVNIQADAPFRVDADYVRQLKVRNNKGEMVPIGTMADVRDSVGPISITRYNMYPAATINGASLPGVSSGTVITSLDSLSKQLLPQQTMGIEWTELTYLQIIAGSTTIIAFGGAVVLVFLVLAAQYESWSLPLSVILVVPMCLLCAIAGIMLAKMDMNIFVQVGFVVLVGLACKNAILVVEFARDRQKEGMSAYDAAVAGSVARLRPIIMTSLAFILGVFPLVISHGAGAEMRRTLGTAVFAGMIGVTLFGIFLTPVFYYVVMKLTRNADAKPQSKPPTVSSHP